MPYESRIPEIIARFESELATVVERNGFRIETSAKRRARVDTGYMRGQIRFKYMEEPTAFTGDENNPLSWAPCDALTGYVAGGAEYTIFNEYGTVTMSAQPMFAPATEEVRPIFERELRAAVKRVVG